MPRLRTALAALALAVACLVPAGSAAAATAKPPHLRLFAASSQVTIEKFGRGPVQLGVGAYLASMGGDFRLDVSRASYRSPIGVTEVIGGQRRALPATVAHGWEGIARFFSFTVSSASRGVIASRARSFCPNDWNRQRVDGSGPLTSRYPQFCGTNPFTLGSVWGIDKGWAVGLDSTAPSVRLPVGTYTVKVSLAPAYADMFGVAAADASAAVTIHVVRGQCPPSCGGLLAHHTRGIRSRPAAAGRTRQLARSGHDARPHPASGLGHGHRPPGRP